MEWLVTPLLGVLRPFRVRSALFDLLKRARTAAAVPAAIGIGAIEGIGNIGPTAVGAADPIVGLATRATRERGAAHK